MATKVLQTLGQRIVAARLAQTPRRMSQRALATKVGISTKSLNQIETGETLDPKSSIVRRISEILGVSADWLLKGGSQGSADTDRPWEEHEDDESDMSPQAEFAVNNV
jgi:transcriptional regulator with XRE-family HTH domain